VAFGEFAKARGASAVEDLPRYVEPFVAERVASHRGVRRAGNVETSRQIGREVRGPVEQMLRLVVPGFLGSGRRHRGDPFVEALPGDSHCRKHAILCRGACNYSALGVALRRSRIDAPQSIASSAV
jgi:hypothetical protein